MIRAMYAGVSGLNSHQLKMDVVGNNVANVNTVGFKSGRVLFQEVFSQTLSAGRGPNDRVGQGGVNPLQVGMGLGISAVDTITNRGSIQRTDNPTDLSIEGEGFFIVGEDAFAMRFFTRAGNFSIDKEGNLVAGNGYKVYGWNQYTTDPNAGHSFDDDSPTAPLNIYYDEANGNKRVIPAKSTEKVVISGNLNAGLNSVEDLSGRPNYSSPFTAFDSLGNTYQIKLEYYKKGVVDGKAEWDVRVGFVNDYEEGGAPTVKLGDSGTEGSSALLNPIRFDQTGAIVPDNAKQKIIITPGSQVGTKPIEIDLDLSTLSMYNGGSSANANYVDGYSMGNLISFNIGVEGLIMGVYDNGKQNPLGQVAIATFKNPAGLIKTGENLFRESANSGEYVKPLKAGAGGAGMINPGTLEMSNVDLSKEFAEMIITQRGFQANSRIISTSDEMLSELINLKR
jgi:flagellar hook protein FlgE